MSKDKKFKVGDVVILKSGSDPMTVEKITKKGNIRCVWFVGSHVYRNDGEGNAFRPGMLKSHKA